MEAPSCSGRTSWHSERAQTRHTGSRPPSRQQRTVSRIQLPQPQQLSQSSQQAASWNDWGLDRCKRGLPRAQAAQFSAEVTVSPEIRGVGEIADVESLDGVRVLLDEDTRPFVEYLVKWKDQSASSWEPKLNLADNLLRDFEERWWKACREAKDEDMAKMLRHSATALAHVTDDNRRSGLHFVAAAGNANCTQMLCEAGADVDRPDKDGFTPLHMAVGYSHTEAVKVLLEAGASPEACDRQGRSAIGLVDSIRGDMPLDRSTIGRRIALEEVAALLSGSLFEETEPEQLLQARGGIPREFLVKWADGTEDSWVRELDIAENLVRDFDSGLEYADAVCVQRMRLQGDQRSFLVEWADGHERTWEPEANVLPALVSAWEADQAAKGLSLAAPADETAPEGRKWSQGGLRGDDGSSADGDERFKVISFGKEGSAQEEAFVSSFQEAQAIAGQDGIIESMEDAVHSNGNGNGAQPGQNSQALQETVLAESAG